MDAFILFVMPPLLGFGIYYVMKHDFVQFMIGYIKKRIGEKKDNKFHILIMVILQIILSHPSIHSSFLLSIKLEQLSSIFPSYNSFYGERGS